MIHILMVNVRALFPNVQRYSVSPACTSGAVVIGVFIFPVLCYWCLGMPVFEWWW